jgi:hypothetical protein
VQKKNEIMNKRDDKRSYKNKLVGKDVRLPSDYRCGSQNSTASLFGGAVD